MRTACISCGSGLKLMGGVSGYSIYRCEVCGLGMTVGDTKKHGEYTAYHRDLNYIKNEDQFKNIFLKRVKVIAKFKTGGKALEIGSSTGFLLSLLKSRGWEVLGIEPSGTSYKSAIDKGIPVLNTTFEMSHLPGENFDLIVMNHVLEHMDSPISILKKARMLLKEDGIIFIDVPNFGGLSAKIRGPLWKYILPEEHKWHFTIDSLSRILRKSGFNVIFSSTYSGIWDYGSPAGELFESLKGLKKRFVWDLLSAIPSFLTTRLGLGSGLTLVARKGR